MNVHTADQDHQMTSSAQAMMDQPKNLGRRGSSSLDRSPPSTVAGGDGRVMTAVRKYLVLLQDSLAIKFVPVGGTPERKASSQQSSVTTDPNDKNGLKGYELYKNFCLVNLQCHWNPSVFDAIANLTYKGYIVPMIILVTASSRCLTTLRGAWSRQMLRTPQGYRIEFIGEIEEILGDPIPQSQFAPLSDSLCWAILEVTTNGQEAFVEAILTALNAHFPTMIMPNRELVYQTLEKMVRDRKIYQTPSGYFLVNPEAQRSLSRTMTKSTSGEIQPKTMLKKQPSSTESDKISRHSWDSTASAETRVKDRPGTGEDELRRHNSMKTIRQKDKEGITSSRKFFRGRSFSFRMYKSQSTPLRPPNSDLTLKENSNSEIENTEKKIKTGTTFLKKLLKRSSPKKSASEVAPQAGPPVIARASSTASTQTSIEALCSESPARPNDLTRTTLTPLPTLQIECSGGSSTEQLYKNRWDPADPPPRSRRTLSRLSLNAPTVLEDCYGYPAPSVNRASPRSGRAEFSPASTLSRGSLGYGSQGQASSNAGAGTPSSGPPTPSVSPVPYHLTSRNRWSTMAGPPPVCSNFLRNPGSYKNWQDYYRRKYPGFKRSKGDLENPSGTRIGTWGPTSGPHYYETIDRPKSTLTDEKQREQKLDSPFVTTVTQKSTTNMQVKLRLPMVTRSRVENKVNVNVNGDDIPCPKNATTQILVKPGANNGETEIKTTVSHHRENGHVEPVKGK